MIAVLLDGTSRYFKPGSAICGFGFKQVTLDFDDCRPEHRDWLNLTLSTRVCEPKIPVNDRTEYGRIANSVDTKVGHSDNVDQVFFSADKDDPKGAYRVMIGIESDADFTYIDLEDVLRSAKKICKGIFDRVAAENNDPQWVSAE